MIKPGSIAIIGAAETESLGSIPDKSRLGLHADASLRALADAGLTPADLDGVATAEPWPVEVAHYLGLTPRWLDGTMVGGCSYMLHVRHAAAALVTGQADVVLISHGESGRSRIDTPIFEAAPSSLMGQFELPSGAVAPPNSFTLPALRFLADRGMTPEHLAGVVVAQRVWAARNPRALRQQRVTVEDVLSAPMVSYPFTRDMCCPLTDGGGALVLVRSEDIGNFDLRETPVYLLGSGESSETPMVSQMEELSCFRSFQRSSAAAFAEAAITQVDVDHLMVYDAFAHVPLYGLEDLGFVGRGESGDFIADGNTGADGPLPMNTNGGGLCYTHTGMYGMFAILEAVRQLRGTAAAQVRSVEVSFVLGVGLMFGAAGSLVLSSRRP
jgi:acetyl-CoA acetyltransferase